MLRFTRVFWIRAVAASLAFSATSLPATELSGFDCLIEPHAVVDVSTREEGVVEAITVQRGDRVKAGQVLARLESGVEEIAVELARARAEMRADIRSKQAGLTYLRRELKRTDDLYKKKAVSFKEKDKAVTDVILAELELREAQENLRLAEIELKGAEQALARRTIRSPVDGVLVARLLLPGESVEDRPIMTVAQVDPLNVEVILPVELFGSIEIGAGAEVRPVIPGGSLQRANVTVVDRVVDAASNTFGVRLELPNPDYTIPGGIRCEIRFVKDAQ